eukprot:XP_027325233.1 neuropeptide W [Anas platyrhynchos]
MEARLRPYGGEVRGAVGGCGAELWGAPPGGVIKRRGSGAGLPSLGHPGLGQRRGGRLLPAAMARGRLSGGAWGALVLLGLMLPATPPAGAWYKHVASPRYHTVGRASGLLMGVRRSPYLWRRELPPEPPRRPGGPAPAAPQPPGRPDGGSPPPAPPPPPPPHPGPGRLLQRLLRRGWGWGGPRPAPARPPPAARGAQPLPMEDVALLR